MSQKTARFC